MFSVFAFKIFELMAKENINPSLEWRIYCKLLSHRKAVSCSCDIPNKLLNLFSSSESRKVAITFAGTMTYASR